MTFGWSYPTGVDHLVRDVRADLHQMLIPHASYGRDVLQQSLDQPCVASNRNKPVLNRHKFRIAVYIVPYRVVVRMKDMRSVLVDGDAIHVLAVDVPAQLRPPVDDQALLPPVRRLPGEGASEQAAAHDMVVVMTGQARII